MSIFTARNVNESGATRYVWFDLARYSRNIIFDRDNDVPISQLTATWTLNFSRSTVEDRGIALEITIKNNSNIRQIAPYIKINSGFYHRDWSDAGQFSSWRHIKNFTIHDKYGMRFEEFKYNRSIENLVVGNKSHVYGEDFFAPCICIDNYDAAIEYENDGMQMVSVSTNYEHAFRLYGEFDPANKELFFIMNLYTEDPLYAESNFFEPNESRTFTIWLRYEIYNNLTSYSGVSENQRAGSHLYRKIAALRSYEPYFSWFWESYGYPNYGSKIAGRIYGIRLAGANAPKSYFKPQDNLRRYYLFTTADKKNLQGGLPLQYQSYVHPQKTSGWKELLDSIVDVQSLKNYGYEYVMLFNIAGWGNDDRGGNPSIFTNLPINLRNTLKELKVWETENNLKVIFAADNVLQKINPNSYYYRAENFDYKNPIHVQSLQNNMLSGAFNVATGVALLDLSKVYAIDYIFNYIEAWRALKPSVTMFAENRVLNNLYNFMLPGYLDRSEFLTDDFAIGGRDLFLDLLLRGADPVIYMPYNRWISDYGNTSLTATKYDQYVQYIEEVHQAIPVTIDRIVQNVCKYPKKLQGVQEYIFYANHKSDAQNNICEQQDEVLNQNICLPSDIHNKYSTNSPVFVNMKSIFADDAFLDYSLSVEARHSWVPASGINIDDISMYGDSLLWLYQDEKLQNALQSIENNMLGINRPNGMYIDSEYESAYFDINFNLRSIENIAIEINVGHGLEMLDTSDAKIILASPDSSLSSRSLRNWWIYVQDYITPGWSSGLTVAEQSDYLQKEWVERWTYWFEQIHAKVKNLNANISAVGVSTTVPRFGVWSDLGLNDGKTNPDFVNAQYQLELDYWKPWLQIFDFVALDLRVSTPVENADAAFVYTDASRRNSDFLQNILFYIFNLQNLHKISLYSNSKVYCLQSVFAKNGSPISNSISDFLLVLPYAYGVHGIIFRDNYSDRAGTLTLMDLYDEKYYNSIRNVQALMRQSKITYDIPSPLPFSSFDLQDALLSIDINNLIIPGLGVQLTDADLNESKYFIAKYGKYRVLSLGGIIKHPTRKIGWQGYSCTYSNAVGEKFPLDYSSLDVVGVVNSVDGVLTLPKELSKYHKLFFDIEFTSFDSVGLPHFVIEDTFEKINSGAPSHLSQVHHVNVINAGIMQQKLTMNLQASTAPAYQAKYIVPDGQEFYDRYNSTIDYVELSNIKNLNLQIPYPNALLYLSDEHDLLVGGYGGVLRINLTNNDVTRIPFDMEEQPIVKEIKFIQNVIYAITTKYLYVYDNNRNIFIYQLITNMPQNINTLIASNNRIICVGAEDGIYAKNADVNAFVKVLDSRVIDYLCINNSAFALSTDKKIYISADLINWSLFSTQTINISKIIRYRSNSLFASNAGIYTDNNTLQSNSLYLQLLDFAEDIETSQSVAINDIDIYTDELTSYFYAATEDGRIIKYDGAYTVYNSAFTTIHKIIMINGKLYVFSGNMYYIFGESTIYRLTTGNILR